MDRRDNAILLFAVVIAIENIPTWFKFNWYIYDVSNAVIIATLILCLEFITREWFLQKFFIFLYLIKLSNIISVCATYKKWAVLPFLDASKPILDLMVYVLLAVGIIRYAKGWEQYSKEDFYE